MGALSENETEGTLSAVCWWELYQICPQKRSQKFVMAHLIRKTSLHIKSDIFLGILLTHLLEFLDVAQKATFETNSTGYEPKKFKGQVIC